MLLVAILLAIAVCAGALACFNATLKRGEKNKTRESVAEWTQQNARLLQYKMDRYYDTLENVARSVQNLPMNSQETQKKIGRNFPTEDTHFIYIRALDLEGKNPEFTGSWKDQQYFKDSLNIFTDSEEAMERRDGIEQIEQILLTSPGVGRVHAFVIADLDNFKSLNDKLGHMWGDQALQDAAKIMKNDCRPRDVICRLGGDEFVLFLQNLPEREVESFAEGLSGRLHLTYSDGSQSVSITASMGIILAGRSETSFQELYARADKELYEVKRTGKGTWHIKE